MFAMDGKTNHYLTPYYYPIVLNNTIVSMLMVYEEDAFRWQLAPYFVNERNILRGGTSAQSPMYLGVNHHNIVGVVEDRHYVFEPDYVGHNEMEDLRLDGAREGVILDAVAYQCDVRRAKVQDWTTIDP